MLRAILRKVNVPDQLSVEARQAVRRELDTALAAIGHALQVHDLLVIGAVVVHHDQHRDAVMRGRPKRTWPCTACRHRVGSAYTDAPPSCARAPAPIAIGNDPPMPPPLTAAHRAIELVDVPQAAAIRANRRPVLALDDVPHFDREPLQRDRARIPTVCCFDARTLERLCRRGRERLAALVERAAALGRDELLARFDEARQRRSPADRPRSASDTS